MIYIFIINNKKDSSFDKSFTTLLFYYVVPQLLHLKITSTIIAMPLLTNLFAGYAPKSSGCHTIQGFLFWIYWLSNIDI